MKITRRDLDSAIIEKLDLLDNVAATYDENNPDGFVSYGKAGFYFKKTNDTFLKKVFNEDEIVALEEALVNPAKNVRSSALLDMRDDKTYFNAATKNFLHNIGLKHRLSTQDAIKVFESGRYLAILFKSGKLTLVSADGSREINLLNSLKEQFALSSVIGVYDIVDIKDSDNIIVVATRNNGIYKITLDSELKYEQLVELSDVRSIEITPTKMLFVAADGLCGLYNLSTGLRAERFLNIKNDTQVPVDSIIDNSGNIFVIATTLGANNLDNMLHSWMIDAAGVAYNCKDSSMPRNPIDRRFQPMFMRADGDFIYVAGLFKEERVFVWKYCISKMEMESTVFDLELDEFTGFMAVGGNYLILSKNMIYVFGEEKLSLKLSVNCSKFVLFNGAILVLTSEGLYELALPKFVAEPKQLLFNIMSASEPCNNIDIAVLGAGRAERISIIDADTKKEIQPSYYMVYDGKSIIKLMNCKSLKLQLKISVSQTSALKGIVVKQNRMFLR